MKGKRFNRRKAILRIMGNTLMAFSLPLTGSISGQQLFSNEVSWIEALFVGAIPATGALLFTTGHEISKRGKDAGN